MAADDYMQQLAMAMMGRAGSPQPGMMVPGGDQGGLGMAPGPQQAAPQAQAPAVGIQDMTPASMGMNQGLPGGYGVAQNPQAPGVGMSPGMSGTMQDRAIDPNNVAANEAAAGMGYSGAGRGFNQPDTGGRFSAIPSQAPSLGPDRLKDAWRSVVTMNPMAAQIAAATAYGGYGSGFSGDPHGTGMGVGGDYGGSAGIGDSGRGGPGDPAGSPGHDGWMEGGYTGDDGDAEQEVAGDVHENEVVLTDDVVDLAGADTLVQLNEIAADPDMDRETKLQAIAELFESLVGGEEETEEPEEPMPPGEGSEKLAIAMMR